MLQVSKNGLERRRRVDLPDSTARPTSPRPHPLDLKNARATVKSRSQSGHRGRPHGQPQGRPSDLNPRKAGGKQQTAIRGGERTRGACVPWHSRNPTYRQPACRCELRLPKERKGRLPPPPPLPPPDGRPCFVSILNVGGWQPVDLSLVRRRSRPSCRLQVRRAGTVRVQYVCSRPHPQLYNKLDVRVSVRRWSPEVRTSNGLTARRFKSKGREGTSTHYSRSSERRRRRRQRHCCCAGGGATNLFSMCDVTVPPAATTGLRRS
jgi:hypothetical protein